MIIFTIVLLVICIKLISLLWRSVRIRQNYNDLYVLITGCDTGFGRELAYRLDKIGFNVIATCLTEEGSYDLDQNTSERLTTTKTDITKRAQISSLLEHVIQRLPNETALWGVVNNAGIVGAIGPSDFLNRRNYIQCLDVNLFGMMEINRQFLPLLRKSRGRIVNMVSMAGKMAAPSMTCYTVSKFAAEGYSDCLRRELHHQGVTVCVIEPGLFATHLMNISFEFEDAISKTFQQGDEYTLAYHGKDYPAQEGARMKEFNRYSSRQIHKVVDAYVDALTSRFPRIRYVVGLDAGVCVLFMKLPEWLVDSVMTRFGTLPAGLRSEGDSFVIL